MPEITKKRPEKLPGRFRSLVEWMPPCAIDDDEQMEEVLDVVDRLMARKSLTRGQERYLETLVQLLEVYERRRHAIDTSDLRGLDVLRSLVEESGMTASDLARLLDVHASMGSKILKGQRSLTLAHVRRLADHFRVRPDLFLP